ncbi:hypothetical protein [Kitasatospora sp. NPDC050543]|uniref:hypothetical protein n=1 Tax=Kitasatospora sp. NPDC050543 TaxID=3364054 RepID=UPI0037950667
MARFGLVRGIFFCWGISLSAPENASSVDLPVPDAAPVEAVAVEPAVPAVPAVPAAPRWVPRALGVALATVGLLAVTATSAAVTVAVGKPDGRSAVAGAAVPAASATGQSAAASPTPVQTPTPTPAPTPSATATPTPRPTSTVHGTVNGGTHGGDLRYFFVPVPEGGESYGRPEGSELTDEEMADEYGGQKDMAEILASYGFKEAVERVYRTRDGKAEVTIRLMRFSSAAMAEEFTKNDTMKSGEAFDIDGDENARGFLFKPKQPGYTGSMVGLAVQGDVEFQVVIDVKGTPDRALLADVVKRQRERLSSGG